MVSGEIAEDLTAYYFISEQQNTAISLGVKIDTDYSVLAAGGMMIQMLPDAQESAIDALEKMLASLPPITTLVERAEACGGENTPQETVLERMLQEILRICRRSTGSERSNRVTCAGIATVRRAP